MSWIDFIFNTTAPEQDSFFIRIFALVVTGEPLQLSVKF